MEQQIKQLSQKYLKVMQAIRRNLHQHPELSYQEQRTSKVVQLVLQEAGIPVETLFNTGVVGLISGADPQGKTVLLRADMDALPIQETADVPYRSMIDNVMHACGHDGHVASLIGAALILNDLKAQLSGNVKLMFQPAEETDGGAKQMIDLGILQNPTVDAAFGLHLWGPLEQGKVEVKHQEMLGAPDEFIVRIEGKGGHAASPEQCVDPINLGVQFIAAAQNILTRRIDPMKPAVISFCRFQAGDGLNVIPNIAEIGGTIRTLHLETRAQVPKFLEDVLRGICEVNGATYTLEFKESYPPLINDDSMTDLAKTAIAKIVGSDCVSELAAASLGAEDFAYLCEAVPASFYYVGIKEANRPEPIHHHPDFQWNDEVLEICAATLAQIAVDFLAKN